MTIVRSMVATGCIVLALSCASTRQSFESQPAEKPEFTLNDTITVDPHVVIGRLDNGVTYYIRENRKPEKRADLRLVVNAGSILEDDDQQGLAHFVEHMAFNGTRHFAKQELVDYLELIGMRFGPDLNAYTSFDETVYMLQVPTDSSVLVEQAFLILEDWAQGMALEEEEIDKERGVIEEEWRLWRGAEARMRDKQYPIIFKNSRYADRLPIGKVAVVDTCDYDTLRRFYRDWYRPELMAVIAVGDFESRGIENLIEEHFSHFAAPLNPRERRFYPVPDHEEVLFAVAADPEATQTRIGLILKHEPRVTVTGSDYRQRIVEALYHGMFNDRLNELTKQADPPLLYAFSGDWRVSRTKEAYSIRAGVPETGIARGIETLLTEVRRVERFGFTETELSRQKRKKIRSMEKAYEERDKTESRRFTGQYASHYLSDVPIPGPEFSYEFYKEYLPSITLQEVDQVAEQWIGERNRVVLVNAPQKDGVTIPTEIELSELLNSVKQRDIHAYTDLRSASKLLEIPPSGGTVVEERRFDEINATEWTLSNAVRVILKPTDFKNDEILFTSFSPGGHSLVPDEDHVSAVSASKVIEESGVGRHTKIELDKLLAGKVVRVTPEIEELSEGISGSCSPHDLESMFQLLYLYFTAPREDSTAFAAYKARRLGVIENRNRSPESAFYDTLKTTLAQSHYRRRPWSPKLLDELDLAKSYTTYKDRFADASDFTFFFVGTFDLDQIKPLIETYLGGLPATFRNETWRDVDVTPPHGVIAKRVQRGSEPKSMVSLSFTGPFEWSTQACYVFDSMLTALRLRLRESIREEQSGAYYVAVGGSPSRYPREQYSAIIRFGCNPNRVDELVDEVFNQLDTLQTLGPDSVDLAKTKQMQRREFEKQRKENRFWLNRLSWAYYHEIPPEEILLQPKRIDDLTGEDIRSAATTYLSRSNYVKVVLYPETTTATSYE